MQDTVRQALEAHPEGYRPGLRDKLLAAVSAHDRGAHAAEWNQLEAFVSQLEVQAGQGVDAPTSRRLIAYAKDLVASQG